MQPNQLPNLTDTYASKELENIQTVSLPRVPSTNDSNKSTETSKQANFENQKGENDSDQSEKEVDKTVILDKLDIANVIKEETNITTKAQTMIRSRQEDEPHFSVKSSVAISEQIDHSPNQMFQIPTLTQVTEIQNMTSHPEHAQGMQSNIQTITGGQTDKLEAEPSKEMNMEDDDDTPSEEEDGETYQEFVETSPSGRFKRFDEELGRGAYKTVFRGVDHDTGREIAWSIINLGRLPKSERPRIKSEIKLIKELHHPNIITFIAAWICKETEQIHFITEIITGGSLRQYLKKMGKPKLKVIKKWCHEVLEGLAYLHSQEVPIIHRDIKCDNIFINSNSGEIKIGDLGLSTTMKHSYTSSVLGTPQFMAPELYEEYYGTEVDIYAFGMALLEMLTREAPYKECQNPAQIYKKVINREYPQSMSRIVDDKVRQFIMWCLDDRTKRPTAKQLLESEFMMDLTSEHNNNYCEISEVPRVKLPKHKKVHKADLPDIEEEETPINEEMDIKVPNVEQDNKAQEAKKQTNQEVLKTQTIAHSVHFQALDNSEADKPQDCLKEEEVKQQIQSRILKNITIITTPEIPKEEPELQQIGVEQADPTPSNVSHCSKPSCCSDSEDQEKLDETIVYLNQLDHEKSNRLDQRKNSNVVSDELVDLHSDNLTQQQSKNSENMLFVDPQQIMIALNEKEKNEVPLDDPKASMETPTLMPIALQEHTKPKIQQQKNEKTILEQMQDDIAREQQQKEEEFKRKKEEFKQKMEGQIKKPKPIEKVEKPATPETSASVNGGGGVSVLQNVSEEKPSKQKQDVNQSQPVPKKEINPNQMQDQPKQKKPAPEKTEAKRIRKADLDEEISVRKKFREDEEDPSTPLKQAIQAGVPKISTTKLPIQTQDFILTPSAKEDLDDKSQVRHNEIKRDVLQEVLTPTLEKGASMEEQQKIKQVESRSALVLHEVPPIKEYKSPIENTVKLQVNIPEGNVSAKISQLDQQSINIYKFPGSQLQLNNHEEHNHSRRHQEPEKQLKRANDKTPPPEIRMQKQTSAIDNSIKTSSQLHQTQQQQLKKSQTTIVKMESGEWNVVPERKKQSPPQDPQNQPEKTASENMTKTQQPIKGSTSSAAHQKLNTCYANLQKIAQQEKSPAKIPLEIKVDTKLVSFDYVLKTDTPDIVSGECVKFFKLDQKEFENIKAKITERVDYYNQQRKEYLKREHAPKQVNTVNLDNQQRNKNDSQEREIQNKKIAKNEEEKKAFQPDLKKQPSTHDKLKQSGVSQKSLTQSQGIPSSKPDYHTEEFLKRRDEFKYIYKQMNNGIRSFFSAMNAQGLDINQVLDIMDYHEESDRKYKREFIQSLLNVHSKFLDKKPKTQPTKTIVAKPLEKKLTASQVTPTQTLQPQNNLSQSQQNPLAQSQQEQKPRRSEIMNNLSNSQQLPKESKNKSNSGTRKTLILKQYEQRKGLSNIKYLKQTKKLYLRKRVDSVSPVNEGEQKMVSELQSAINQIKFEIKVGKEIEQISPTGTKADEIISRVEELRIDEPLAVDGKFGNVTENEVVKIQEKLNIEADGVVTEQFVQKMENLLTKLQYKNDTKIDMIKQQQLHADKIKEQQQQVPTLKPSTSPEQIKPQFILDQEQQEKKPKRHLEPLIQSGKQQNDFSYEHQKPQTSPKITKIKPLQEIQEEQGSSGGTNPLSGPAKEDGYDGDQTFMTMNSKEPGEANYDDEPLIKMNHTPSFDPRKHDVIQKSANSDTK